MASAACDVIDDQLTRESGRINPMVINRLRQSSPWFNMVKQGPWIDEMGVVVNALTWERSFPADDGEVWANLDPSANGGTGAIGGLCLPTPEIIKHGQTLRTYQLQRIVKETEDFCIEGIRSDFQLAKQLQGVLKNITDVTRWVWENRYRNEYLNMSGHKITLNGGFEDSASAFNAALPPIYRLTQGILEPYYLAISRDGGSENAFGMIDGSPVYLLVTSAETSRSIIRSNPDIRNDVRWAFATKGSQAELLRPLGVSLTYEGFTHMVDPYPIRYDLIAGVYVRRQVWVKSSATKGFKWELNPLWANAEFEVSFIFHQDVFTSLVPAPITNPGGSMSFGRVDYAGDFAWKNILDKACNPDGTIGFWRSVYAAASEPILPNYGYSILHKRCPLDRNLSYCS